MALTAYVARLPPTPLAFGNIQIEALWGSVREKLATLGSGAVEELEVALGIGQVWGNWAGTGGRFQYRGIRGGGAGEARMEGEGSRVMGYRMWVVSAWALADVYARC